MITLRKATDIPTLMDWRREVLENVFGAEPADDVMNANRRYYERHIADGSHVALIAEADDGEETGCGALCLYDEMPSPENPDGLCGYLMNIYVRAPHRRRGIGSAVVRRLVELARERGCGKIYLETTDLGRPLYKELDFEPMPDMMKLKQ